MTEILFVAAIVVVLAIAFVVLSRRSSAASSDDSARDAEMEDGVVSEPVPVAASVTRAAVVKAEVEGATVTTTGSLPHWATQFEPRSGRLDNAARLKLINDLGMLRAAWCIPVLEQAFEDERDITLRTAAQVALERCRNQISA
jgi:hypothetical protein